MEGQGKSPRAVESPLERIDIVLNRPRHGGNVGAAARAVKNMGLGGMRLVALEEEVLPEARMLAAHAVDILESARSFDTLDQALAGNDIILGTSRRVKSARMRILTPREAAAYVLENLGSGRAALIFGPEDSGLMADELSLCHGVVSIPADERCPSLNLAQAVMVLAYDLRMALDGLPSVRSFGSPTDEEKDQMFVQLMSVLERSGFFIRNPREKSALHMREIFSRGVRTSQDARIVRGIFRRIGWALSRSEKGTPFDPGDEE